MKTPKLIIGLLTTCVLTFSVNAQTNQPSNLLGNAFDELKHASNYSAFVYATHFDKNDHIGGGLMVLYNFNGFVGAGVGADYAGQWRYFNGTVNVHYSYQLSSRISVTAYALAAAGSSIGGAGADNGTMATGEGGGINLTHEWTPRLSAGIGLGYITRQNCGDYSGGSEMLTLGLKYKF